MNQEFPTIELMPTGNGVYRLFSFYDKESIALTAQALLELADWIAAHRETLALEARQEVPATGTGTNMPVLRNATSVLEYIPRQDTVV